MGAPARRKALFWGATLVALAAACGLDVTGTLGGETDDGARDASPGDDGGALPPPPAAAAGDSSPPNDSSASDGPVDAGPPCPPDMVDTDAGFCIDRIEVTQAAYDVFFQATAAMDASTPGPCAYKKTHDPSAPGAISTQYCSWNPATHGARPVTCVDWCDAKAYCEWAGKRLCGRLGGGSVPFQQALEQDASVDEWDYACSAGGTRAFAYGNTFDSGACKDDGNGPADDAGSHPDCVGGFPGLFDMSGNALEWEDSCNGDASANDKCRARGGSWYFTSQANERCDAVPNGPNLYDLGRSERYDDTGFRCCKDAR